MITAVLNTCKNTNIWKAPDTAREVISEKWVSQSRGLIGYIHVPMSHLRENIKKFPNMCLCSLSPGRFIFLLLCGAHISSYECVVSEIPLCLAFDIVI